MVVVVLLARTREDAAATRVTREREDSRAYWVAVRLCGVPLDSVTQLTLLRLRARAAGKRIRPDYTCSVDSSQAAEVAWSIAALNPFAPVTRITPRNAAEGRELAAAREEVRVALAAAQPAFRAQGDRTRQRVLAAACVLLVMSGIVAFGASRASRAPSPLQATYPHARRASHPIGSDSDARADDARR